VVFAPTTATAFSRTLTVAYTGATVTPTPVTLNGTGVATRATVSLLPNPLTINLVTGSITATNIITLTNAAPLGTGSSMTISNVVVNGGIGSGYLFNKEIGADNCTGASLAPGASCTVSVRFTNLTAARGVNRTATITFTDTASGSPQTANLIGFAQP
jgi:hypothetical protein